MAGRGAKWTGVAAVLLLLAADVSAQGAFRPMRGRGGDGGGPQRIAPDQRQPSVQERRLDDSAPRDGRRRLSPEERRQLRRDVHDAGRDLYPERMRPGPGEPRRP